MVRKNIGVVITFKAYYQPKTKMRFSYYYSLDVLQQAFIKIEAFTTCYTEVHIL